MFHPDNYGSSGSLPEKNVSSPEDIILSEHVEESLPRELCDIPLTVCGYSIS
jgi:hypothetical protein